MPRLTVLLVLATLLLTIACDGEGEEAVARQTATPAARATDTSEASKPAPTDTPAEFSSASEPVSFQTPDGALIEARLLSVPGPNQKIVLFVAPDVVRYRDVYSGVVGTGVAVLAFSAGEDAGPAIETAVRLARSREYPLIYLVTADAAGANATQIAAELDIEGLVVSDALSRKVEFFRGGTELEENAILREASLEVPGQLRELILRYLNE